MTELHSRASGACELCGATDGLEPLSLDDGASAADAPADRSVLLCDTCHPAAGSADTLDDARWFCLQESIWSEVPAVQVLSYRLLHRTGGAAWASDLLEQVWLADDVLAWAHEGLAASDDSRPQPVDSNGAVLSDGDSVTLIKDLAVKGAGFTAKRGTLVKNIRVGDDPSHIEGRVNKVVIMLKTEFLKRA